MSSNLQEFEINNQKTEFDENEKNEVMKSNVQKTEIVSSDTDIADNNDIIVLDYSTVAGRRVSDREDVMHSINVCAALFARDTEYHYIQMENDKLKYTLNKQLMDIREKTLNNYDEILNSMNRFSEEIYIKDLKISQLMEDLSYINVENEKKDGIIQLLKDNRSESSNKFTIVDKNFDDGFDDLQISYNELYEGKLLISDQINQLVGSGNIETESYQLSDLVNNLLKVILDKEELLADMYRHQVDQNQQLMKEQDDSKEWQKHLETENKKLNSEIENREQIIKMLTGKNKDHINLKENHSKLQQMYDELYRDDTHLRTLIDKYKRQLSEKEIKYIGSDILIKTLQFKLTEMENQFEQANSIYKNEKEKCQKIQSDPRKKH